MNEKELQRRLYWLCIGREDEIICPNTLLYSWESDMVGVTKAGRIHEYEVKISRADFRADLQKNRHEALLRKTYYGPNRFWYVAPEGLLTKEDMPEYAGLIILRDDRLRVEHRAPERHRIEITDSQRTKLYRSMMQRFWRYRGFDDRHQ